MRGHTLLARTVQKFEYLAWRAAATQVVFPRRIVVACGSLLWWCMMVWNVTVVTVVRVIGARRWNRFRVYVVIRGIIIAYGIIISLVVFALGAFDPRSGMQVRTNDARTSSGTSKCFTRRP